MRTTDLLTISALAALGLAMKPILTPLVHLVSVPLMIPGGSLAGGFYMLWLALAVALVKPSGAATLVGLIQGVVMMTGFFGSHGLLSLISYPLPGVAIDLLALVFRQRRILLAQTVFCTAANLTGTGLVVLLVMRLTWLPAILALTMALISGILGGFIARWLIVQLERYRLVETEN